MQNRPLYVGMLLFVSFFIAGCASYAVPGRGANLAAMSPEMRAALTDSGVEQTLNIKPLASFPAAIAVARVQASGYCSRTAKGWGEGAYSIVTTRDIEKDEQIDRLGKLPMVNGIAPMNRLLLPSLLQSDEDLRHAAARLHADLLLIYTIDTTFKVEDKALPLSVVTLGLSPNRRAYVTTTASAVLLDTRNGYVYGLAEATHKDDQLSSAWTDDAAVDQTRLRTETAAFDKLVGDIEKMWGGVIRRYGNQTNPS